MSARTYQTFWMSRRGGDGGEVPEVKDSRVERYQTLYMILAYFYLFLSLVMFIMAAAWPGINLGSTIVFLIMAAIVLIAAVVQIIYRKELISYACGVCPLAAM